MSLSQNVDPPRYLEEKRFYNLTSLVQSKLPDLKNIPLESVDVLKRFPTIHSSGMDESQMLACKRVLTTSVGIVMGPPGSGKTFVSVAALRLLIRNLEPGDPPIIISAQTNHALDQLLTHISRFERNYLRLGGRYNQDNVEIRERSLFHLRRVNHLPYKSRGVRAVHDAMERCVEAIKQTLSPLFTESMLAPDKLLEHGVISESQYKSLYDETWVQATASKTKEWATNGPLAICKQSKIFMPVSTVSRARN